MGTAPQPRDYNMKGFAPAMPDASGAPARPALPEMGPSSVANPTAPPPEHYDEDGGKGYMSEMPRAPRKEYNAMKLTTAARDRLARVKPLRMATHFAQVLKRPLTVREASILDMMQAQGVLVTLADIWDYMGEQAPGTEEWQAVKQQYATETQGVSTELEPTFIELAKAATSEQDFETQAKQAIVDAGYDYMMDTLLVEADYIYQQAQAGAYLEEPTETAPEETFAPVTPGMEPVGEPVPAAASRKKLAAILSPVEATR